MEQDMLLLPGTQTFRSTFTFFYIVFYFTQATHVDKEYEMLSQFQFPSWCPIIECMTVIPLGQTSTSVRSSEATGAPPFRANINNLNYGSSAHSFGKTGRTLRSSQARGVKSFI